MPLPALLAGVGGVGELAELARGQVGHPLADVYGVVADPFGHQWQIATHKEDLTPDEIMERGKKVMAGLS